MIWGFQDSFAFPQRGMANEKLLGSKNLFSESWSERPYYYREVISVFWFGGSQTCLPSPEGGRQTKSCSDQKTYLAKVVRSGHITIEKWSRIFDLGGLRLVCLPPKGEGKRKVVRIKKLYQFWNFKFRCLMSCSVLFIEKIHHLGDIQYIVVLFLFWWLLGESLSLFLKKSFCVSNLLFPEKAEGHFLI